MPRLIEPPSLRKVSLQSIVSNYSYWCVDQSASQADFISPFRDLGDDMIQELIRLGFPQSDIQYLFHHNLRHLDLGGARTITDYCIQLLGNRCPRTEEYNQNAFLQLKCLPIFDAAVNSTTDAEICEKLTHLSLNFLRQVQPATLCELVSSLPQILSLQLEFTNTDRSVLRKISDNCPKLLDLNIQCCFKLNDEDFLLLCNQPESSRIRPHFTQLKLSGKLSVDTVVALLNSHRNLRSVGECNQMCQALDQMYGKEYQLKKEFQQTWIHNLSEVTIHGPEVGILDLELTTLCCPHLTRISLNLYKNTPIQSLRAVSKLKSLKALNIKANMYYASTFRDVFQTDVVPILDTIGGNLTSVCFRNIGEVCVFRIGELCPNLQSLDLIVNFKSSTYNPTTDQHFRQLRVLEISYEPCETDTIPVEALSLLLENAMNINELTFNCVNNLTDNIILKANKKHGFRFLTEARFHDCIHITKETGMTLLSPDNPLEYLRFDKCQGLTIQDEYELNKYAKHRQITIDYDDDETLSLGWNL